MHTPSLPAKALPLTLLAVLMLTACSTQYGREAARAPSHAVAQRTAPAVAAAVAPEMTRQVEIISEPPGARIEINDAAFGKLPIVDGGRVKPMVGLLRIRRFVHYPHSQGIMCNLSCSSADT